MLARITGYRILPCSKSTKKECVINPAINYEMPINGPKAVNKEKQDTEPRVECSRDKYNQIKCIWLGWWLEQGIVKFYQNYIPINLSLIQIDRHKDDVISTVVLTVKGRLNSWINITSLVQSKPANHYNN